MARLTQAAELNLCAVLERMVDKNLLVREKTGRADHYSAAGTRGEMIAELLRETLRHVPADERAAALVAFVSEASTQDRAALRTALDKLTPSEQP